MSFKMLATLLLLSLAMTGCSGSLPAVPFLGNFLSQPSLPEPKVSRQIAISQATQKLSIMPYACDFSLDLAMLTSPGEIEAGKVPGKTGIAGVGFAAMGMLPDERFWLVRFKKGDPEKGPPYALLSYKVDAETADAVCLTSEGQVLPGQEPLWY